MIRSERWNSIQELKRIFPHDETPDRGAGPIMFAASGNRYLDDSEAHIASIGKTGRGKSQAVTLPFCRDVLRKESAIILDPKNEIYQKLHQYIPSSCQVFRVDLRDPRRSPNGWNPLILPYKLYHSNDPSDRDRATDMIAELWTGVYPPDSQPDRFWTESSANFAKGLTYALFELADNNAAIVNLDSVAIMMEQAETRIGGSTAIKELYDMLPEGSIARRNLATYVTAPNDTRASIHSVAVSGLEIFSRSQGLMQMMADDSMDIDFTRRFVLFICVADESENYHGLAGLLVSQLAQQLVCKAQELGGRLPVRVNIVLEELGSVGKTIPNLPNLLAAGRSRNIRMLLVLQSEDQLVDIYGKAKAEAIRSCIGVQFCFSTNSWDTLTEWSRRCGERKDPVTGHMEPLITAAQLAAMPVGTALVLVDGRYKYIANLPMFYQNNDLPDTDPPVPKARPQKKIKTFDLMKAVTDKRKRKMDELIHADNPPPFVPPMPPFIVHPQPKPESEEKPLDIDAIVAKIDAQIAKIEAEEAAMKAKEKPFCVSVETTSSCGRKVLRIIRNLTDMPLKDLHALMARSPFEVRFASKEIALRAIHEIEAVGGTATLKSEE